MLDNLRKNHVEFEQLKHIEVKNEMVFIFKDHSDSIAIN